MSGGSDRTGRGRRRWQVRPLDVFAAPNLLLLAITTVMVSWPRFVRFRGAANAREFAVYMALTMAVIVVVWVRLRHLRPPTMLLVTFELAFVLAVIGAIVPVAGGRLYDVVVLGVRFDKLVHAAWALAGALAIAALIDHYGSVPWWMRATLSVLAVLGLGAAWEMVEYAVVRSVAGAGVGGYDNNMQDLIGNLVGGLLSLVAPATWRTTRDLRVDAGSPEP